MAGGGRREVGGGGWGGRWREEFAFKNKKVKQNIVKYMGRRSRSRSGAGSARPSLETHGQILGARESTFLLGAWEINFLRPPPPPLPV